MTTFKCPRCGVPSDYALEPKSGKPYAIECPDCYRRRRTREITDKGPGDFNSLSWASWANGQGSE